MFGPNAALNIPGSLYASTADYLKLGETGRFDVTTPNNSLLTVAPPSAFGFLDNIPAGIIVEGSPLILPNDEMMGRIFNGEDVAITTLGLVGGNITIKDAQILTYGNDVNLVSVASQGEVPIDPTTLTDDTFAAYGTLSITDTGTFDRGLFGNIDASGFGGGEIYIRAGKFFLDNGWVFADTWHNKAGRGITVHANDALTMKNGSRITTEAFNSSQPNGLGPINVGNGGSITITASNVSLTEGSQIQSTTKTAGNAGKISISAQNTLSLKGANSAGDYKSGVLSNTLLYGSGGEMEISAKHLVMEEGATIRGETWGLGEAGNVSINVDTFTLSNGAEVNVSAGFLGMPEQWKEGTSKAGKLTVIANQSVSIGGGEENSSLLSSTFTQGQGGTIEITSPDVTVHEKGSIQANSLQEGDAGSLVLNVDTLNLTQGGYISAETFGNGLGGDIEVQAQNIRLSERSDFSASSTGEGNAGSIILNLGDKLTMRDSSAIGTLTTKSDGGNISITAQNYLYLIDSKISTSVAGGLGKGGNITLRQEFVVQDESPIIAEAYGGPGGNINITTTGIYKFSSASLNNRISASSQYGVDGIVTIETPDNSAEEEVVILATDFLDVSGLLDTPCGQRVSENLSRFLMVPSEGTSNAMSDLLASGPLLSQLKPIVKQEVKQAVFQKDKHFNIVDKYYAQNKNFATCQLNFWSPKL